jgi:hypothetical protein
METRMLLCETYPHYVKTLERESRRAREQYDLLLIPGAELTHASGDPDEAGHALAVGLRSRCSVHEGLEPALRTARASGAAIIAALPTVEKTIHGPNGRRVGSGETTSGWAAWSTATSS